MKKIIALLLLLTMLLTLAACATKEKNSPSKEDENHSPSLEQEDTSSFEETTTAPQEVEPSEAAHEGHHHIAYRGVSHRFDLEEMERIEGKPCDYSSESVGATVYIYNNISFDGLDFTQIQYTFSDASTRVSCTHSVSSDLSEEERAAELAELRRKNTAILNGLYGEGNESENSGGISTVSWRDDIGNYILMMQLNDTTLQVCFYLCAD